VWRGSRFEPHVSFVERRLVTESNGLTINRRRKVARTSTVHQVCDPRTFGKCGGTLQNTQSLDTIQIFASREMIKKRAQPNQT
jgi:hypothetical protein